VKSLPHLFINLFFYLLVNSFVLHLFGHHHLRNIKSNSVNFEEPYFNFIQHYRTVQAYVSREDALDLSHYKLWYKVQHDRIKQQSQSHSAHTANISLRTARQKSDVNNGFGNMDSDGFTISSAISESAFSSPFVGR
jgi:hypothetical protein